MELQKVKMPIICWEGEKDGQDRSKRKELLCRYIYVLSHNHTKASIDKDSKCSQINFMRIILTIYY